jgi:periplasmic protein TonB
MNRPIASHGGTNGASRGSIAYAEAFDDDPMSKVLGLDAKTSSLAAWFGFTSGGTLLAAALVALASVVAWLHTVRTQADRVEEIEVIRDEPPPPPPPVAEAQPEPEAKPAAPPPPRAHEPPPPPAPAQAAKVLTQEPTPNEPVDLTGNTIVQGEADAYAGGFTTANGTGTNAVRSMPVPGGVAGGTGTAPAPPSPPPGPDLSRKASLAGAGEWRCPFPPEADTAQVDEAWVTLQADVRADGTPTQVRVLKDPGNGFGREARRCAMNRHWSTALDHDGTPIPGSTGPVTVHFTR